MSEADDAWRLYLDGRRDMMSGAGVGAAIPKLEEAFRRLTRVDLRCVAALADLAQALLIAGRIDEAARRARELVVIGRMNHAPWIETEGEQLLGRVAFRLGRNEEALHAYDSAEKLAEKANDNLGRAGAVLGRGEVLHRLGRNDDAVQAYELAEKLAEKGGDDQGRASAVLGRGEVLFYLGRNDEALRAYELAEKLAEKVDDDLSRANAVLRRGLVLFHLGRNDEALRAYESAEKLAEKRGSPLNHAGAVQGRGEVLFYLGRNDEALRAYESAEKLAEKAGEDVTRANAILSRGRVLFRLGRNDEALRAYESAEKLAEKVGDNLSRANAVLSRGEVLFRLGRNDEALRAYESAEKLAEKASADVTRANAILNRGEVLFRLAIDRRDGEAFQCAESYMDTALRLHRKHGIVRNVVMVHSSHARALLESGQHDRSVEVATAAFVEVDQLRTHDTSLLTRAAVGENYNGLVCTLINAQHVRNRVGDAVRAFEGRRGWTFEASTGDPLAPLEHAHRDGGDWLLLSWQPPAADGRLRVVLASPKRASVHMTLAGTRDALVDPLNNVLRWQYDRSIRDQGPTAWETVLTRLATVCMESEVVEARGLDGTAQDELRGKTLRTLVSERPDAELRIVPVDVLQLVPWAALPWGGRRLIEVHPVVLGTTLERVFRPPVPVFDGEALVVGNPDATLQYASAEARIITEWLTRHSRVVTHHGPSHPLTASYYREHAARYGLHHLSTHAAMNWVSLMDSVVVMSGGTKVRLPEILELSLRGSTVVLSACQSSMGDPKRLFDTVSLSAAYLAAGAGRVLGTLWTVDDKSTALLMLRIYQGVLDDGLSWPRAVQRAQVDMIHGRLREDTLPEGVSLAREGNIPEAPAARTRPRRGMGGDREAAFSSPYHWGAFALYGR